MIRIEIPSKYIKNAPISGNPDYIAELDAYASNMFKYGILPKTENGITTVELVGDAETDFDLDHLKMLITLDGVTVSGYKSKSLFKVSDMNETIPEFLPNSIINTYDEETGDIISSRTKTWNEWIGKNYTVWEVDGFYYFLNYANDGVPLGNEAIIKLLELGFELVDNRPLTEEEQMAILLQRIN